MADSDITIQRVRQSPDYATILGLLLAVGLIGAALFMGGQITAFYNLPSVLIVICGTVAVTTISFSGTDLAGFGKIIKQSFLVQTADIRGVARQLLDMAVLVRRKGPLALQNIDKSLERQPFLREASYLVMDGITPDEIERILSQDMEAFAERFQQGIGMLRRGAEVAPAMGLIGTLIGLVQMLATLDDPSTIGPSMAVALLTTFYGAILGSVILTPLANKLEKRMSELFIERTMIVLTAISMARKENPRRLEMLINTTLPPEKKIRYFSDSAKPKN